MASEMGEGGQISLKCITEDLSMMIVYKNNHGDLAWNYPHIWPKLPLSSQIAQINDLPIAMI